jgi:hypothetical protein
MKNARAKAGAFQLGGEQHPNNTKPRSRPLLRAPEAVKFRLAALIFSLGRFVP